MTLPLVALGIPCGDRVHQEFMQCIWGLGRGARNHRQGIVSSQSSMVTQGRNLVVDGAREIKADYLMFLDSDMTFPHTLIDRLLAHGKDIVGCTYVRRGPPFDNLGKAVMDSDMSADRRGLIEMTHMPTGLLLIKMGVFDFFVKPIFRLEANEELGITTGEDMVFSRMAREKGFKLFCDLSLSEECAHMYQYALRPTDPAVREMNSKMRGDKLKLVANA